MKLLMPIGIAILGLGVGVGAGVVLKPAPEAHASAACGEATAGQAPEAGAPAEAGHASEAEHAPEAAAPAPCPPVAASGPLEPVAAGDGHGGGGATVVALDKPFVVPVFAGDKVVAMVVASVAVEIAAESETMVEAAEPRLRDGFLAAMFRHANSGGFEGAFTTGQRMADLRAALLAAAREVFPAAAVGDVLITEIAKQDV